MDVLSRLKKQGYHIVGKHSAVKTCKWTGEGLKGTGMCYKHEFYGIDSHRCVQCTPALQFCTLACRFCWRTIPETKNGWSELPENFGWDEPAMIVEGLLEGQKILLSGYGAVAGKEKFAEANRPKHAAISLTGEPTMYPRMGELIGEFHKRGMTTFLMTNGTLPEQIRKLETEKRLPTQLYVSMIAPNWETYERTALPENKKLWRNYLETLEILKRVGVKHRTALRMTLVKRLNFNDYEKDAVGYASQIGLAKPCFVEVKSFVYVGGARNEGRGLRLDDMLEMGEVREFAGLLAEKTGYVIAAEHAPSRVVLLCGDETAKKNRIIGKQSGN